ncbi:MAG: hypothetical protein LC799_18775 [Actinobacteria bacterium]|nr:hypothetical protein [Actinomycetota bacterium]
MVREDKACRVAVLGATDARTSGPETFELTVLRRVAEGAVSIGEGGYLQHGCLIGGDLAAALTRLSLGGCLTMGQPGPDKRRAVSLTAAGASRRAALERGDCRG